jgi:hypothetical protein
MGIVFSMDSSTLIIGTLAILALTGALLLGPMLFGRLFMPRLTLALFQRFGGWLRVVLDRISPGLDLRLIVRAGNKYFRKRFGQAPFEKRVLFLPFCLRPLNCPAEVDPEKGLCCEANCSGCEIGAVSRKAKELGYAAVYVVPSSRMMPEKGLLPSDQFIKAKLKEHAPDAALGVVCPWHLRNRLLKKHTVGRRGLATGQQGVRSALQGVLLDGRNCRAAKVDWEQVRKLMSFAPGHYAPSSEG